MIDPNFSAANPVRWVSQSIRPILPQISIAMTSTVLAIFGGEINDWFKAAIKRHHFVIRVTAFVLLVAFGYGALNLAVSHLLSKALMQADDLWLSPVILGVFVGLGVLAEERRQI